MSKQTKIRIENIILKILHALNIYKTQKELEKIDAKKRLEEYKISKMQEAISKVKKEGLEGRLEKRRIKLISRLGHDRAAELSEQIKEINKKIAEIKPESKEKLNRKIFWIKHERFRINKKPSAEIEEEKKKIEERLKWKPEENKKIERSRTIPQIKRLLVGERKPSEKEIMLKEEVTKLENEIKELENPTKETKPERKKFEIKHEKFVLEQKGSEIFDEEQKKIENKINELSQAKKKVSSSNEIKEEIERLKLQAQKLEREIEYDKQIIKKIKEKLKKNE